MTRMPTEDDEQRTTHWRDRAACAEIGGDLWFPETGDRALMARQVCLTKCKVREQCLEYAVTNPSIQDGIWGGLPPRQIRAIRVARGLPGDTLPEDVAEDPEAVYE